MRQVNSNYAIEAKITNRVGEYPFTLLFTLLNKNTKVIPCAEHSKLKKEINYKGIQEHLEMALSKDELKELKVRQNKVSSPDPKI